MSDTNLAPQPVPQDPSGTLIDQGTKTTDPSGTPDTTTKDSPSKTSSDGDGSTLLTEGTKKPDEVAKAPDKYSDFKPPAHWNEQGWELDKDLIANAVPLFKDLNLSQDQAQRLIDFYTKVSEDEYTKSSTTVREQTEKWVSEVKADPEIGGKLDQVKATVSKAIDGLGDPKLASDFREAMDFTGAGNNPAFIRAFYKLAQKVTEGTIVSGGRPSPVRAPADGPRSAAKALYPNLPG